MRNQASLNQAEKLISDDLANGEDSTTVTLDTKAYGKIEVSSRQQITFAEGLYGFEDLKTYYFLDIQEGPFYWLQSADDKEIAFVVVDPYSFKADYKLELREADYKSIGLGNKKDRPDYLIHFVIVTIPDEPKQMTANLLGPVIINAKNRLGKQVLSTNENYNTRHNIIDEMENTMGGGTD